ncbi:hypothetical protein [Methanoculleus chikugoensis]|uniref:hypothetical protein n=1 Tax=Methanoculleus chikugoensis TaxID=118126 RepID=UPI001FB33ED5|nr:hypothetical protein [Methanoculleus chikugoensis]
MAALVRKIFPPGEIGVSFLQEPSRIEMHIPPDAVGSGSFLIGGDVKPDSASNHM